MLRESRPNFAGVFVVVSVEVHRARFLHRDIECIWLAVWFDVDPGLVLRDPELPSLCALVGFRPTAIEGQKLFARVVIEELDMRDRRSRNRALPVAARVVRDQDSNEIIWAYRKSGRADNGVTWLVEAESAIGGATVPITAWKTLASDSSTPTNRSRGTSSNRDWSLVPAVTAPKATIASDGESRPERTHDANNNSKNGARGVHNHAQQVPSGACCELEESP